MCAASPASSTRPRRYSPTCRVASVKELTHFALPAWIDSPVMRSQASATSAKLGVEERSSAGVPCSQTMIRSTPSPSGAAITMPPGSRSPRKRGRRSQPTTSARYMPRVAGIPGKSKPPALRTPLCPPSQPTR
nr:hypothetical protein GCM10020092_071850 [Actinoplanes digitatis]